MKLGLEDNWSDLLSELCASVNAMFELIDDLRDIVQSESLDDEPEDDASITEKSPIGIFLTECILGFDLMTFEEIASLLSWIQKTVSSNTKDRIPSVELPMAFNEAQLFLDRLAETLEGIILAAFLSFLFY